jgi:hypothetical protein
MWQILVKRGEYSIRTRTPTNPNPSFGNNLEPNNSHFIISQGSEPDRHQIRSKLGPASIMAIYMRSGGLEASEDKLGSQGYGLHLKRGGDPKDPSSDWPLHKLVILQWSPVSTKHILRSYDMY